MRSMIVVVDIPDAQRLPALQVRGPFAGIAEFLGQDPVVALDLPVVERCVGADPLVTGCVQDRREDPGLIAGRVVGGDTVNIIDAVGSEGPCLVHEIDCGNSFLVIESFCIGQPRVAIDRRMQEQATSPGAALLGTGRGFGLLRTGAVDAPAAAVGYPLGLLHIDVNHMNRPASHDTAWCPVAVAVGADEPAAVQSKMRELAGRGAHRDGNTCDVEFERDAPG